MENLVEVQKQLQKIDYITELSYENEDCIKIDTNKLFDDNYISVYVELTNNNYVITDYGYMLEEFFSFDSSIMKKIQIEKQMKKFGVLTNGQSLFLVAKSKDDIVKNINTFIEFIQTLFNQQ